MKRNRLFLLAAMLPMLQVVQAQTSYDASVLLDTDLSGTARYVGMGGAMSALGADMSTMGTNPAGTALYRSWDVAFSFGGNGVTQHTQTNQGRNRTFNAYGSMDNVGMVIANKNSNTDVLRFVNFGFNYRNVKRFGGKMGMKADLGGLSQTNQMVWQAYDNPNVRGEDFDESLESSFYKTNYYGDAWVGWLTLLGTDARLMDASALDNKSCLPPSEYYDYSEVLSGGIDAYDFNLSFNLMDAVYLGATFTVYDVNRVLESTYTEYFDGGDYFLQSFYRTIGSGYDLKLGAIVRPFPESSFRIGVSATTPTVYALHDYNSAMISSLFYEQDVCYEMDTYSEDALGGDYLTSYTMIAPAKFNVSMGGTIGRSVALGAEYEYTDYGHISLYDEDGYDNVWMNEFTDQNFTGKHTFRLGAEKTFGTFYTRLGYNYESGGYKDEAYKALAVNSVQTHTAYANIKSTQNYTCGIGFRGDAFYVDAALLYSTQKADFYPFDDPELQAAQLTRNLVKGMMTVGLRF